MTFRSGYNFSKSRRKQPISKILFLKSYQNQGSKPPDLDKNNMKYMSFDQTKKEQNSSMCTGKKVLLELNESLCD